MINTFYPQMNTPNSDGNFQFTFGAADIPTSTPNYESAITFDSAANTKSTLVFLVDTSVTN